MFDPCNEAGIAEEDMIRRAVDFPVLSPRLRERVIDGFVSARRRRDVRRRIISGVCLLLWGIGLGSWSLTHSVTNTALAFVELQRNAVTILDSDPGTGPTAEAANGPATLTAMSETGGWGYVDAAMRLRERHRLTLRVFAGSLALPVLKLLPSAKES